MHENRPSIFVDGMVKRPELGLAFFARNARVSACQGEDSNQPQALRRSLWMQIQYHSAECSGQCLSRTGLGIAHRGARVSARNAGLRTHHSDAASSKSAMKVNEVTRKSTYTLAGFMWPVLVSRPGLLAVAISYTVNETSSGCTSVTKTSSFVLLEQFSPFLKITHNNREFLYKFARCHDDVK